MDTYEKKYNEALERARIYRDNAKAAGEYAMVARYENIFPELRESEDERIRKAIIAGIKRCADAGSIFGTVINNEGVNYHDVLAWLEKQKEKEQKPNIEICPHSIKSKSYLETGYPIEPNPAWGEEDKKMLADTIFKLAGFMGNEKNIDWLKSLRPSWKPSDQ